MEFNVMVFVAIYALVALVLFLRDETDFALLWLFFLPLATVWIEAGWGRASTGPSGLVFTIYDLLMEYFLVIMAWIFAFFLIHLWRIGFIPEVYGRMSDTIRSNRITGYTPQNYKDFAPRSAALMGTSTCNFTEKKLSIRDAAFIDLSVFALQSFNQRTNIAIVNHLGLPGDYYKSVHSRISGQLNHGSHNVKDMVRMFMRETAGNYDMPSRMLKDLCAVAIKSDNTDSWTRTRLYKIAKHLKQPRTIVDQAFMSVH